MKIIIFLLLTILPFFKAMACSCDTPKPALEFHSSEYVFEGIVTSKVYASDSLTFTITFDISKHYKKGDSPSSLNFTMRSEGWYVGEVTSCDWNINKGERWLVYAHRYQGKLVFGYFCANSKPLSSSNGIGLSEKKVLENGNNFDLSKYIINRFDGVYLKAKPLENVDSILNKYDIKSNSTKSIDIVVDIDMDGNLMSAKLKSKSFGIMPEEEWDPIFGLNKHGNFSTRKPENQAEKDLLKMVRQLKKWEKAYLNNSKTAINYRKFLRFTIGEDSIKFVSL